LLFNNVSNLEFKGTLVMFYINCFICLF